MSVAAFHVPRLCSLAIALLATTACGQPQDVRFGDQLVKGEWQEPLLKGCSAEVSVRLPVNLLDAQQDWRLKAGSQNCPMGHTSLLGTLQEFMPLVSPETRAKLEALDKLAVQRIAEMKANDPGFDPEGGWGGTLSNASHPHQSQSSISGKASGEPHRNAARSGRNL